MSTTRKHAVEAICIASQTADDEPNTYRDAFDPLDEDDRFESDSYLSAATDTGTAPVADESYNKLDHSENGNSPKSPSKRTLDKVEENSKGSGSPPKHLRHMPKPNITSTALALFAEFRIRLAKCELDKALEARRVDLATLKAYEKSSKDEMNLKVTRHVEMMRIWAVLITTSPAERWNDVFGDTMHGIELFISRCKIQRDMCSREVARLSATIPTKKSLIEAYKTKACLITTKWRREVESNDEDVTCIELLEKLLQEATSLQLKDGGGFVAKEESYWRGTISVLAD